MFAGWFNLDLSRLHCFPKTKNKIKTEWNTTNTYLYFYMYAEEDVR